MRARVGIVGGGQLARMTQQAAVALDIDVTVLTDDPEAPAVAAGARACIGRADDLQALRALADASDVVTFDHEGVPPELLGRLAADGYRIQPSPDAKLAGQDKLHARRTLAAAGVPVPRFTQARTTDDVVRFATEGDGWPVMLKARRGGYDGRGVAVVHGPEDVAAALASFDHDAVVETYVDLAGELAVLVARRPSGEMAPYPAVQTIQEDGMCRELFCPAPLHPDLSDAARRLACEVVEVIGATGVVAVELFLDSRGDLLVNEVALRPHNAGHWTIEGAETSQFEQHLRAVLDWPLGSTAMRAPAVAMVNVIGRAEHEDPRGRLPEALAADGAHFHLYGKDPRPGRKLGHVTASGPDPDTALATARAAASRLEGR